MTHGVLVVTSSSLDRDGLRSFLGGASTNLTSRPSNDGTTAVGITPPPRINFHDEEAEWSVAID